MQYFTIKSALLIPPEPAPPLPWFLHIHRLLLLNSPCLPTKPSPRSGQAGLEIWVHSEAQQKGEYEHQATTGEKKEEVCDEEHVEDILLYSNHDEDRAAAAVN